MGAPVREADENEPSKSEPLKSESSKPESLRPESLKPESLKNESLKRESLKPESSKNEALKNRPSKDEAKKAGAASANRATEVSEPPWKRKTRRSVFEGDVAVVELRSRLALAPERVPEPAAPKPTANTFVAALRLMGGILTAAAVAGVTGYLWGFRLSTKPPQLAPASDQANVQSALSTAAANLKASNPDAERPSGLSTQSPSRAPAFNRTNALPAPSGPAAAIGPAPVDTRRAPNDVNSVEASQRPMPPATAPRRPISPSSPSLPPASADDIATKMRIGAELMANGDIAAARMMFERVAEDGEAAGAFALAETYDPVVLRRLRLRGGGAADVALARRWYEMARDLGSTAAPERISRLAQIPQ